MKNDSLKLAIEKTIKRALDEPGELEAHRLHLFPDNPGSAVNYYAEAAKKLAVAQIRRMEAAAPIVLPPITPPAWNPLSPYHSYGPVHSSAPAPVAQTVFGWCGLCGKAMDLCMCVKKAKATEEATTEASEASSKLEIKAESRMEKAERRVSPQTFVASTPCYFCSETKNPKHATRSTGAPICTPCALRHLGEDSRG
jgi:hypothetical protein